MFICCQTTYLSIIFLFISAFRDTKASIVWGNTVAVCLASSGRIPPSILWAFCSVASLHQSLFRAMLTAADLRGLWFEHNYTNWLQLFKGVFFFLNKYMSNHCLKNSTLSEKPYWKKIDFFSSFCHFGVIVEFNTVRQLTLKKWD